MKCPNHNPYCTPTKIYRHGRDWTCAGVNTKPKKYKKDVVKLCLHGYYSKGSIESTPLEALEIADLLNQVLTHRNERLQNDNI